jgi:hypothetical protein
MPYHYSSVDWARLLSLMDLARDDHALLQKLEEEAKYRISRGYLRESYCPLRVFIP